MRYLCIDYGLKKIGIAISDEEGKFAFPLSIIQNKKKEDPLKEILNILKEKNIINVVVGESLNLKGEANEILKEAKIFSSNLKKENNELNIYFEKEWLSTVEARRYDDRKDADDSAAAIILQRFLDKKLNMK